VSVNTWVMVIGVICAVVLILLVYDGWKSKKP
jgi:hypothetical protein